MSFAISAGLPTKRALLAGLVAFTLTALIAAPTGDHALFLCAFSLVPSLMLITHMAYNRQRDVFHPLSFCLVTVFLGVTAQMFYLAVLNDGSHRFSIGGRVDIYSLCMGLAAICLSIACLLVGYSAKSTWRRRRRRTVTWKASRVVIAVAGCLAIGGVSFFYYLLAFDIIGNLAGAISAKRRIIDAQTGIPDSLSWVMFAANFAQIGFLIGYAFLLHPKTPRHFTLLVMVVACAVIGILVPFLTSNRTGLITFVISGAMINYYFRGGWSAKQVQIVAVLVLSVIVAMGALRYTQARGIGLSDYRKDMPIAQILEPVLASDNFLSIGKTSAVIDAVPSQLDYQYGRTYLLWAVSPIPRAWWHDKPIVRIGLEVGREILGTRSSGMPPGIIGELYYNFGWIGLPFGMMLAGFGLRWHYERFGKASHHNMNAMQIYAATLVWVSFFSLSADFTGSVAGVLQRVVPLALILLFITVPSSRLRSN